MTDPLTLPEEQEFQAFLFECVKAQGPFDLSWNDHQSLHESLADTLTHRLSHIDQGQKDAIQASGNLWMVSYAPLRASDTLAGLLEQLHPISPLLHSFINDWEALIKRICHHDNSSFYLSIEQASDIDIYAEMVFQMRVSHSVNFDSEDPWKAFELIDSTRWLALNENIMSIEELDALPPPVRDRTFHDFKDALMWKSRPDIQAWLSRQELLKNVMPSGIERRLFKM